jgi:hypothetical protein
VNFTVSDRPTIAGPATTGPASIFTTRLAQIYAMKKNIFAVA